MNPLRANDYWRPNENYTSTERYRPIVVFDYKLYICIESHTSTSNFNDNLDKFIKIGGSSVSGGSIIPYGTWDIKESTTSSNVIPSAITFNTYFNVNMDNNNITLLNNGLWNLAGYSFGGTTTVPLNLFNDTRWTTIEAIDESNYSYYFIISKENVQETMEGSIQGYISKTDKISIAITKLDGYASYANISVFVNEIETTTQTDLTGIGTTVNIGINSNGQILIKSGSVDIVIDIALPSLTSDFKLSIVNLGIDQFPLAKTIKVYPVSLESPPLQTALTLYEANLPQDASDGSVWEVIGNGFYNTTKLLNGDYVVFYNNMSNVIVVPNSNNTDIVTNSLRDIIYSLGIPIRNIPSLSIQTGMVGKIHFITNNVPLYQVDGTILLTLDSPSESLLPFTLYVYRDSNWVSVSPVNGNYLYYFENRQFFISHGPQSSSKDLYVGVEPFTTLNSSTTPWRAIAPFPVPGQSTITINNYIAYVPLNDSGGVYCELIDTYQQTEFTPNGTLWRAFKSLDLKLHTIKNPTLTTKEVKFSNVTMSLPFSNNVVSILPGKSLVVGYREIDNQVFLEYVSGNYKNTEIVIPANQSVTLKNIQNIYVKFESNASVILYISLTESTYTTFDIFYNSSLYTGQISIECYVNGNLEFTESFTPALGERNQRAIINDINGWVLI